MANRVDNFLAHYGVKGMKWGKRQAQDVRANEHGANLQNHTSELRKLSEAGRGNDLKAVGKANQKYETERRAINARYKEKVASDSGMSKAERKAADRQIKNQHDLDIVNARSRQQKRTGDLNVKAGATYAVTTQKGLIAATAAYDRAATRLVTNPDAHMASRMTSGERAANNVVAALGLASIAFAAVSMVAFKD